MYIRVHYSQSLHGSINDFLRGLVTALVELGALDVLEQYYAARLQAISDGLTENGEKSNLACRYLASCTSWEENLTYSLVVQSCMVYPWMVWREFGQ